MMILREFIVFVTLTTLSIGTSFAASIEFDIGDYEVLSDTEEKTSDLLSEKKSDKTELENKKINQDHLEVRCYCNQPHCVSQGYMCRGRGCFTELPSNSRPPFSRPEHSAYSGCLETSFTERPCLPGLLCCEQDLCNHVDSPAMRSRLNKTLQVLMGEHRLYFQDSSHPTGQAVPTSDNWFKAATIAVPICGFFVLLVLASLAIRLLQPLPSQDDKLNGFRIPENTPPLLSPMKAQIV